MKLSLTRSRIPLFVAVMLVVVSGVFLVIAARSDTLTTDESPHITAGYAYVRYLDFRLNPEHPPLIKALSALPLLAFNPTFPTDDERWIGGLNEQWGISSKFLYESGNDPDTLVFAARLVPILFTLGLTVLIFIWGTELVGSAWALLPAFLFALSPHIIAHGHLVTTDIAAAFGVVLSTFLFLRYLLHPSPGKLVWAGVGLGIAELLKFSLVLLIPYFAIVMWTFAIVRHRCGGGFWAHATEAFRSIARHTWALIRIVLIAYLIVYAAYVAVTFGYPPEKQLSDTRGIIAQFTEKPAWFPGTMEALVENRLTRPFAHYVLGFSMVLVRASAGNTGYFLDMVTNMGWPFYFPTVFLLKEPLPSLILLGFAAFLAFRNSLRALFRKHTLHRFHDHLEIFFPEFALLLFVVIYWVVSIKSPLNIGIRHIFPALPFMYLLATSAVKRWVETQNTPNQPAGLPMQAPSRRPPIFRSVRHVFIGALVVWYALETIAAAPFFLSYFNELAGGTARGYRYVVDSNYDWGQDLKRFVSWVEEQNRKNPDFMKRVAIDYFGTARPQYYFEKIGVSAESWWPARGNPKDEGIDWFAVSVSTIQGNTAPTVRGFTRPPENTYMWLTDLRPPPAAFGEVPTPEYRIGTSILLYKL